MAQMLLSETLSKRHIVMKQPTFNPSTNQNWCWPEKTWFQERLHAIKAKEQELRRKPIMAASQRQASTKLDPENGRDGAEPSSKS